MAMKKYLAGLLFIVMFASCKKWLDVKPESEVSDEDLYKTAEGFQEALNGVYMRCSDTALYGAELTAVLPEVLAQNYTTTFNDKYKYARTALYNYRDVDFILRRDIIWRGLYNAIMNCNVILDKLEKNNVLDAKTHDLIKGEALGMRAFLHFDALRLFAPSYVVGAAAPGIPYVTTVSNKVTEMSTVTQALDKIIADLLAAKELLTDDPIRVTAYQVGYPDDELSTEQSSPALFLHNRRFRMNYFAVTASLARAYLYLDKKEEAAENALEIITAQKFPWTKQADFIASDPKLKDRIMYPELIFAWYAQLSERPLHDRFESEGTGLFVDPNTGTILYETGGVGAEDLRFKEWFRMVFNISGDRLDILKYVRNSERNRHPLCMPAIKFSEMFYIASEALYDTDPATAVELFDIVRARRGISAPLNVANKNEFLNELVKEIRKETFAEGQVFFAYKRLNKNIIGPSGTTIPASNNIFVLPLPDDEIEFGGR